MHKVIYLFLNFVLSISSQDLLPLISNINKNSLFKFIKYLIYIINQMHKQIYQLFNEYEKLIFAYI